MASGRTIRRRIKSISGTAQITKAMQMVAAAKMRKAQQAAIDVRPFVQRLYRIRHTATTGAVDVTHPLLESRPIRRRAVILAASDKGLCGALNSNLFRVAGRYDPRTTVFIAAGRKAAQFLARTRRDLKAEFPYGDSPRYQESRAIAALARELFVTGVVDAVDVVATRFVNTLVQQPMSVGLLQIGDLGSLTVPGMPVPGPETLGNEDYLFEASVVDVVAFMLEHYLNVVIHVVLLNAKASEQSARMVSMKNATESAADMIMTL